MNHRLARRYARELLVGSAVGVFAAGVQAAVGFCLQRWFLPPGQDDNIAPRLVKRLLDDAHQPANPRLNWILGTLFHLGYGAGWGVAFGQARRRLRLPRALLATVMGALIYALAFSAVGVGTLEHAERRPSSRGWRKEGSLLAIVSAFSLAVPILDVRLARWARRWSR